jgi:hypothetical protein
MEAHMQELGSLEKINLRKAWKSEAKDFTPWLGMRQNIRLLGKTLRLDLEVEAQEKEVGPFRADILCKDTATNEWVLVENQLERTDHTHLGQLMTYAAGLDAVTIVWVAARFAEEHRATLDWLNSITEEKFKFFGVEVELWRIGESAMAPKFNVVSKPNDWSRSVRDHARKMAELTETGRNQIAFWTAFNEFMQDSKTIRTRKPAPQNWMYHPLGRSGFVLCSIVSAWDSAANVAGGEIRAEFMIDHPEASRYYELVLARKDKIEDALGESLVWYCQEGVNARRIFYRKAVDIFDQEDWPNQFAWLKEKLEKLFDLLVMIVPSL